MSVYRKTWTAGNGWTYTLDIVPYDADITDGVLTLSAADANLIEVGTITHAFDELPIGLMRPPSMTLKVVLNRLPSALQSYLRVKYNSTGVYDIDSGQLVYPRNTFILKTDKGIAGETHVLFAGVQAKINSQSYTRANGEYIVDIECVDAVQHSLSKIAPGDDPWFAGMWDTTVLDDLSYEGQLKRKQYAFELLRSAGAKRYASWYVSATSADWSYFNTWQAVFHFISRTLSAYVCADTIRQASSADVFDRYGAIRNDADNVVKFAAANRAPDTGPRTAGAYLTTAQTYLLTHIRRGNETIGGLASKTDAYGWGRYESYWDLFKDLFENLFIKAGYRYVYGTGGDAGKLFVEWDITPVLGSVGVEVDIMDSLTEPEIVETESAIGRCEVRYETQYPDATVTDLVSNAGVVRADRQYTVDAAMHNVPIFKGKRPGDIYELGMLHCNLFWFNDTGASDFGGDNIVKVHENLRLFWGSGGTQYIDYNESAVSHYPPKDKEQHSTWCMGVQAVTGLPFALADMYTRVFGQDDIATLTIQTRLTDYFFTLDISHTFAGAITTDIPHLGWSRGIVASVDTDVMTGTQTTKFLLLPTPS